MKILVFGSFNIDKVYKLARLPERGETLYCGGYEVHVGGKGLNQALAFRKAGADVFAAGKVGVDGDYLTGYLSDCGVDVSGVGVSDGYTGHTIIEVDPDGQNQMILFSGANAGITEADCDEILKTHGDADLVMTQYETSCVEYMLRRAKALGIKTALNPSPFVDAVKNIPFDCADILILNESEGFGITGEREPARMLRALQSLNGGTVILTLGADGAMYYDGKVTCSVPAFRVDAVDTTGAGDTFTGYSLYALLSGETPEESLRLGSAASAIEVTRTGAAETIPGRAEVLAFLETNG